MKEYIFFINKYYKTPVMTMPLLASGRDGRDETMTFGVELTFNMKISLSISQSINRLSYL